ncbi:multiple epidermal growth factor-like domains protein 10 isoform X2 [Hyposmocoma kahamanoa]|uniref:multiple epidermal growth factor-like domains protein 10 isoform X2 n=1 Tax=Hyposmocoma kahamanoa TaxID=1477025 RepID=UPI000E6D9BF9|nr:multiple epidermal growth factor-like domains protein 10 isoform X2 [Hyposmocoma kahamanoa]
MMGGREVLLIALLGLVVVQGQEKRRTSNNCQVDMDCPDNAFCRVSTYCVCKEGYVYTAVNSTHKSCLKEANFGEECTHNIQCQAILGTQSECKHGVCRCVPTAHWDVRCFETALVGERCTVDQNCYLGETGPEQVAYCVRGYCTCPLQSSPRDNGTRCVRDSGLGGPCEDQLQCAGAGLECQGTCQCRKNWVAHNDSKICVEAVHHLGEACEYDVQCDALSGKPEARSPGAALCLGGVCQCAYSARATGTPERCWQRKRPGQDCVVDEECVSEEDEPGYCLNGICTCKNCSPDAKDFFGGASTISRPPVYIAAIIATVAILRH